MKIEKDKITVNYVVMICFDIFRFDSVHKFYNLQTGGPRLVRILEPGKSRTSEIRTSMGTT